MENKMIESARGSQFQLPVYLLPIVAFGINLIGDMVGGGLGITACNRFNLGGDKANRVLLLSVAVNAIMVLLWVKFVEGRRARDIGLTARGGVKGFAVGASAGLLSFALILGIGCAAHVVSYQSADFSTANVVNVLFMIPFWIIQGGAEEILTRGWVLPAVSAKSNRMVGIIVSSALFVALHIGNTGLNVLAIVNIFLIGVLLAVYTLRSDNLWGAIAFHAFWNFTQGTLFGLSVSGGSSSKPTLMNFLSQGNALLGGGRFGIEASIITTVVIGLMLTFLLVSSNKAPKEIEEK